MMMKRKIFLEAVWKVSDSPEGAQYESLWQRHRKRVALFIKALKGRHKVFRPFRACVDDNASSPVALPQAIALRPFGAFRDFIDSFFNPKPHSAIELLIFQLF
jgi:hypothetical protein